MKRRLDAAALQSPRRHRRGAALELVDETRALLGRCSGFENFDTARVAGIPYREILRAAREFPADLVVIGTHDSLTPVEEARLFVELLRRTSREPVCYAEISYNFV